MAPSTSMYTLGINAAFHDPAACLVRDGMIVSAAEEEHGRAKVVALIFQSRSLLQKPEEWGQAGAGANHNQGCPGIRRQAEGRLWVTDEGINCLAFGLSGQEIGADALIPASPGTSRTIDHSDGDGAGMFILQGRG